MKKTIYVFLILLLTGCSSNLEPKLVENSRVRFQNGNEIIIYDEVYPKNVVAVGTAIGVELLDEYGYVTIEFNEPFIFEFEGQMYERLDLIDIASTQEEQALFANVTKEYEITERVRLENGNIVEVVKYDNDYFISNDQNYKSEIPNTLFFIDGKSVDPYKVGFSIAESIALGIEE